MPITFHTPSYADLTFLSDVGKQLIELMGLTPNVPGALLADDIDGALARLRAGLASLEVQQVDADHSTTDDEETPLPLSRRAKPLLELLESARAAQHNVMWD